MIEKFLNNRLVTLIIIPLILGASTVFSYQPFNITFINFLLLPLFFYLIIFIKKKSLGVYRKKPFKKNLFLFGTFFGFGFYLSGLHWITNSLTFDENFKILIPFALILIPLFLSLFFSLVVVILGPFLGFNLSSIFLLSSGLAFSDYLRAKIFTGFPWNLWAYSFSWSTEIIQILNPLGLFTFNLIVITIFFIPVVLFFNIKLIKKIVYISIIPLIVFLLYIYGSYSINQNAKFLNLSKQKFYIKIVSPNFKLEYGLSENEIRQRFKKLVRYSNPSEKFKTLYVWPEGVFSGYNYKEIAFLKDMFSKNFKRNHFILFGINRYDESRNGFYNSLVLVNSKMEILQEYRKQKLVPFGEFIPFEKVLSKFNFKKITEGYGSFLKGNKQKNIILDELNILPLVCYEIIFTEFIQNTDPRTNLIINISEDGWFGNSIGPKQHFAKAVFRAVENNSFLIRSANKGISAIIDNKGLVLKKLDNFEAGNIEFQVPLIENNNRNKNDLIFLLLLITYIFIFSINKKNNEK